jgi:deazaflavin-dependent oxidoreductase (nitroreductase family)
MEATVETAAEYNTRVIDEFRANKGRVGGIWEGVPLLLLHHAGARSGASRVTPLGYLPDDQFFLIFASNGGARQNPDWYFNLKAHPRTRIEVGAETIDVAAKEVNGEERERLFARGAEAYSTLAEHARRTDRVVPVIVLKPASHGSGRAADHDET